MTDFQNLHYETKNHIAYITIDRPKVLNALSMAVMDELRAAFAAAKDDPEVRVVILTGAGEKAFVAGADINELAQLSPVAAKEFTHRGQSVLDAIENLGKPVIACINGFALGGGCGVVRRPPARCLQDAARRVSAILRRAAAEVSGGAGSGRVHRGEATSQQGRGFGAASGVTGG